MTASLRTGTLKAGDRVLAINGESLFSRTLPEAVALLSEAGDVVTLKISKVSRKPSERTSLVPRPHSFVGRGGEGCGLGTRLSASLASNAFSVALQTAKSAE